MFLLWTFQREGGWCLNANWCFQAKIGSISKEEITSQKAQGLTDDGTVAQKHCIMYFTKPTSRNLRLASQLACV